MMDREALLNLKRGIVQTNRRIQIHCSMCKTHNDSVSFGTLPV